MRRPSPRPGPTATAVVGIELADGAVPLHEADLGPATSAWWSATRTGACRPPLLAACDAVAFIPQLGRVGSLNVATAAADRHVRGRRRRWTSPVPGCARTPGTGPRSAAERLTGAGSSEEPAGDQGQGQEDQAGAGPPRRRQRTGRIDAAPANRHPRRRTRAVTGDAGRGLAGTSGTGVVGGTVGGTDGAGTRARIERDRAEHLGHELDHRVEDGIESRDVRETRDLGTDGVSLRRRPAGCRRGPRRAGPHRTTTTRPRPRPTPTPHTVTGAAAATSSEDGSDDERAVRTGTGGTAAAGGREPADRRADTAHRHRCISVHGARGTGRARRGRSPAARRRERRPRAPRPHRTPSPVRRHRRPQPTARGSTTR